MSTQQLYHPPSTGSATEFKDMPRKRTSAATRHSSATKHSAPCAFASLRRRPLQRRGTQRLLAVLDACDELLTRMPFDRITISEIARTSGVPVGTIYFFFEDRTTIFLCVIERVILKIRDAFIVGPKEMAAPLPQYFAGLERRLEKIWSEHRSMMEMVYTYCRHPTVVPIYDEAGEFTRTQLAKKLEAEFPQLRHEQAITAGEVISQALTHVLDVLAYMPPLQAKPFKAMWRQMIDGFVRSLGQQPLPPQ